METFYTLYHDGSTVVQLTSYDLTTVIQLVALFSAFFILLLYCFGYLIIEFIEYFIKKSKERKVFMKLQELINEIEDCINKNNITNYADLCDLYRQKAALETAKVIRENTEHFVAYMQSRKEMQNDT